MVFLFSAFDLTFLSLGPGVEFVCDVEKSFFTTSSAFTMATSFLASRLGLSSLSSFSMELLVSVGWLDCESWILLEFPSWFAVLSELKQVIVYITISYSN